MKKRIIIVVSVLILFVFTLIPINDTETVVETRYNIRYQFSLDSATLPNFGVQIDTLNTNDTIILNENPLFHFAFFYNVSLTSFASPIDGAYGGGTQPDNWWFSQEVDFEKYGDDDVHFLETRMYGSLEVYIDDHCLGFSNFDVNEGDDTNQTCTLDLSLDEHYLTIIAAEYQLPYVGATIDEAELVWTKDQHIFYVKANVEDPLPVRKDREIYVSTSGIPYTETFDSSYGFPLERPIVELVDIDDTSWSNIEIDYQYNISTDGTFSAYTGYYCVEFDRVGDGTVVRWINDDPFSTGLQQLRSHHNYVYICAISTTPDDFCAMYGIGYYPILVFDTLIVDLYVETEYTVYEGETVTVTSTIYETEYVIDEFSYISFVTVIVACILLPIITIFAKKIKQGGNKNEV